MTEDFGRRISSMANGNLTRLFPQYKNACLVLGHYQLTREHLTTSVYANLLITSILHFIASPITVFLSCLVIYCVFTKRSLRKRNSNIFLALLSVTDLAVGAIGQPLYAVGQVCRIISGCDMCLVQTIPYVFNYGCCSSSLYHLMLVAVDRLIAIKCTMHYQSLVTTRHIICGTVCAWGLAIFCALLPIFGLKNSISSHIVIGIALPAVVVIVACYIIIYFESRRHKIAIAAQTLQQEKQNKTRSLEFKALKTTSLVVTAAFICYGVGGVVIIVAKSSLDINDVGSSYLYWNATSWGFTAVLMNSLFNPIIYAIRNQEMRDAFKTVLSRVSGRTTQFNQTGSIVSTSQTALHSNSLIMLAQIGVSQSDEPIPVENL